MNFYEEKLYSKFNEFFRVKYKTNYICVKFRARLSYPEIRFYNDKKVKLFYTLECDCLANYETIRNVIIEMKGLIDMYPDEYKIFTSPSLEMRISEKLGKDVSIKSDESGVCITGPDIDMRIVKNTVSGKYKACDKHSILQTISEMEYYSDLEEIDTSNNKIYAIGDIVYDGRYKKVIVGESDGTYKLVVLYEGYAVCYNAWPHDTVERLENHFTYIGHYDDVEKLKQSMVDMIMKGTPPLKVL